MLCYAYLFVKAPFWLSSSLIDSICGLPGASQLEALSSFWMCRFYAGDTEVFALDNKMESTQSENQTDIKQDDTTQLSKQDDEVILHL
jgi:hypothetical protein